MYLIAPRYPCDEKELREIENLLSKIDLYHEKINEIDLLLEKLSEKAWKIDNIGFRDVFSLRNMVLKSFFCDIENKEFSNINYNRIFAEVAWEGLIFKRNPPCEICGENRSIDRCHIIPNKLGGTYDEENILFLCPTHHRLFDRFMLTPAEWGAICWDDKTEASQIYAETVIKDTHFKFWNNLKEKNYQKLSDIHINMDKNIDFFKYVVYYVRDLFYKDTFSEQKNIYALIEKNLYDLSLKIIKLLKKEKLIVSLKKGSKTLIAFPVNKEDIPYEVIRDIALTLL